MSKSTIQAMLQRPIAYHAIVAKAFDSVKLAVLWSQLFYWTDRSADPDGWIYKTSEDITEETGLSRREQETARERAKELGVIEEQLRKMPATLHFRIDLEKSLEIIDAYVQAHAPKRPVRKPAPSAVVLLPEWLDPKVWTEWTQHRREKKKALTPLSIKKQLQFLTENKADYKAIIEQSIQNGWTGLFPVKNRGTQRPTTNAVPAAAGKYSGIK